MSQAELEATLEEIFADILPEQDVPPRQATQLNSPEWDSFVQLALITAIEQEFSITISEEDGVEINSFDSALEVVREELRHVSD